MDIAAKKEFIRKRLNKPVVLVGLMGSGKSALGKIFAESLGLEFVDSDDVIKGKEKCSIEEIFEKKDEKYFRDIERKVILDLMDNAEVKVIATGGGAFMNDETRAAIQEKALSLFLNADLDLLVERVGDGKGRPLLENKDSNKKKTPAEIREIMETLMEERYPTYGQAHMLVPVYDVPKEENLNRVHQALYSHLMQG